MVTTFEQLASNTTMWEAYEKATSATTSIDLFNNWVEELQTTGYLHNHSRMWFASIWVFTLRLPWQLGADFFYRHLLDGDAASNTLSWRWVAGLHTKGKIYAATRDNILHNARERGAQYGAGLERLAVHPEPLIETPPWPSQPQQLDLPQASDSPNGVDLLVVHEDDLGYELHVDVKAAVALAPQPRSPRPSSAHTIDFSRYLLSEAVQQHKHASAAPLNVAEILAEVKRSGVTSVFAPFAPVGPANDALNALESLLTAEGIEFTRIVRQYDRLVWPHATKGFFALNKKIPELLADPVFAGSRAD